MFPPMAGQFLFAKPVGEVKEPSIRVVQSWHEEFHDLRAGLSLAKTSHIGLGRDNAVANRVRTISRPPEAPLNVLG